MIDGFYKVEYSSPLGGGSGVVVIENGRIRGGDSVAYFVGSYALSGPDVTASVRTDQHSNLVGFTSILGSFKAEIRLKGTVLKGDRIELRGISPQAPDFNITFMLTRLPDA